MLVFPEAPGPAGLTSGCRAFLAAPARRALGRAPAIVLLAVAGWAGAPQPAGPPAGPSLLVTKSWSNAAGGN